MIRLFFFLCALLLATSAQAQTVVAKSTIRSKSVIGPGDIAQIDRALTGTIQDADLVIGMEARTMLYPGRPIRVSDIGPPAIVTRNQIVILIYSSGGLTIQAEGRSLERGGAGDVVRVLNVTSKNPVTGTITPNGHIKVNP
jgi:flagella basal body P-ring formation protein FlgA